MSEFDYYLLNFSYAPDFCKLNPDKNNSEECIGNFGLVLHGLWTQYLTTRNGKEYPEFCHCEYKSSKQEIDDIIKNINGWEKIAPEYIELSYHEWTKHGTCTGLSPKEYFVLAIELAQKYYKDIPDTYTIDELKELFKDGDIKYDKDGNFSGVSFKIDKDGNQLNIN